jgi:hypothetical protein
MHFMNRNNRLSHSARGGHIPNPWPGRAVTPTEARIAVMRMGGMSTRAIRRALGLSQAAATAAGLLESGPSAPAPAPGGGATTARGPGSPRMAEVLDAVSRGFGVDRKSLIAPDQRRRAVRARQMVMCLVRELCPGVSLQAIGLLLDRDHTTVHYGCRRAAALLRRDRAFREAYLRIRRALTYRVPEAGSRG